MISPQIYLHNYIYNRHTTNIQHSLQTHTYRDILHKNYNTIKIHLQQCNTHEY